MPVRYLHRRRRVDGEVRLLVRSREGSFAPTVRQQESTGKREALLERVEARHHVLDVTANHPVVIAHLAPAEILAEECLAQPCDDGDLATQLIRTRREPTTRTVHH